MDVEQRHGRSGAPAATLHSGQPQRPPMRAEMDHA